MYKCSESVSQCINALFQIIKASPPCVILNTSEAATIRWLSSTRSSEVKVAATARESSTRVATFRPLAADRWSRREKQKNVSLF